MRCPGPSVWDYLYPGHEPTPGDGPRGDPAGLVVLPARLRGEPDGGRLWRGHADRFWSDPPGSRAALRRREDVAGPRGGHVFGGGSGVSLDRAVRPLLPEFDVVVRVVWRGIPGLPGPRLPRA